MNIRFYPHLQTVKCVCGFKYEVMRKTVSDPDAMFELMERLKAKHKDCGAIANAPATPCAATARL